MAITHTQPSQPCLCRLMGDDGGTRQHTAGEDVLTDEIGTATIYRKLGVRNSDRLQDHPPTHRQPCLEDGELSWPTALAYRLDHLDRHNVVKSARHLPIILKPNLSTAIEPGVGIALL